MGSKPYESEKGQQTRSAAHDQARRRRIHSDVVVTPDGWKLCLRDKDLNELYNLTHDPEETRNLYPERQYASVISRLTDEIHRWQKSTGDKLKL